MAGDDLCQVLFYKLATFIWGANQIKGDRMQDHQDKLINSIFGYKDKYEFLEKLRNPMTVETWDGKVRALISVD